MLSDSKLPNPTSYRSDLSCRVILLGASNLMRGISTVVETAQIVCRQPLQIITAAGLGRSYGIESRVLGRTLPGIIHCSLWESLSMQAPIPTFALITDVGNDILYGVEVPQIVDWVKRTIERLQRVQAQISMTLLPPIDPSNLSSARFHFFRTLFFPNCRLKRDEVVIRAQQLHNQLFELRHSHGIRTIEQSRQWYAWDPIHIRRRQWRYAWHNILSAWNGKTEESPALARGSLGRWLYLQTRQPYERSFWSLQQRREQPSAKLRNGTTVSFY
jgi:hypothetical protein